MRNNSIRLGLGVLCAAFTLVGGRFTRFGEAREPSRSTGTSRAPIKILLFYDMEGASGVVDDATMNPEKRKMLKVDLNEDNAVEADKMFTILMGDIVEPRKQFIEDHALNARLDV